MSWSAVLALAPWLALQGCSTLPTLPERESRADSCQARSLAVVRQLSSKRFEGRHTAGKGNELAERWIERELQSLGAPPAEPGLGLGNSPGSFRMSFEKVHGGGFGSRSHVSSLVVQLGACRPGGSVSIISAHLDGEGRNSPGADDNASGIAALLEATARLTQEPEVPGCVLLHFSNAEEQGCHGSRTLVARLRGKGYLPRRALVLDMVGRPDAGPLRIFQPGDFPFLGDHACYQELQVGALLLSTGVHADYHQPGDDWEKTEMSAVCEAADHVFRAAQLP